MKKRTVLLLQAISYGLLAVFFISMPLWVNVKDSFGTFFVIGLSVVFGFFAFKNIRQLNQTGKEELVYAPPKDASKTEQASFYMWYFYATLIAFPLLTLITVWDLNDLEGGIVQDVRVWAPIAFLYEQFGYWTAVLSIPLTGLLVAGLLFRKWRLPLTS